MAFWIPFGIYQTSPLVVVAWYFVCRRAGRLRVALAAVIVVAGTAAAWWIAETDSSSTSVALLLFSPVMISAVAVAALEAGRYTWRGVPRESRRLR